MECGKDAREASGADWGIFASPAGEAKAKQRSAKSLSSPLQMQPVKWYKKPGPPQLYTVFVASPSDVSEERKLVLNAVDDLNLILPNTNLRALTWERDAHPGFGVDGQDVINRQLDCAECDIFVGVMWTRFGTPTSRAASGTEEEFLRAYRSFRCCGTPRILLYFCRRAFSPEGETALDQYKRVLSFKKTVSEKGSLYWEYETGHDFERLIRVHLAKVLGEIQSQDPLKSKVPSLVLIPAGEFFKGEYDEESDCEDPRITYAKQHLPDYYIGKYPVTNYQYSCFVAETGSPYPRDNVPEGLSETPGKRDEERRKHARTLREYLETMPDHPVISIHGEDAQAYCTWLSTLTVAT